MAKVTIAGNSYVITSAISKADLEMTSKYRPSALTIIEPETKDVLFAIGIGPSSVTDYGVCFSGVSNDDAKLATATFPIPSDVEDAKAYVLDEIGLALTNLKKVEANITAALGAIRADRDAIAANIDVSV